ncbi:Pyridoxine 5'-phosphate synthase [bacterium HR40]|nr:Pyridoxine 5'-phosphate synthase [bacterium HR40]
MSRIRLGVNIDHIATLRNARGGSHPDPLRAARMIRAAGGDQVTAHLREDRRHITDADMERLVASADLPVNMEMAATAEMLAIALRLRPHACCIVPERREERTTESGLDVLRGEASLCQMVPRLRAAGIRVSLFVDPDEEQLRAAARVGADAVELHTGTYALARGAAREKELERLRRGAALVRELGLECHAGHGLDYDNVSAVAAIPEVVELNIGHFLIGEAIFVGFTESVRRMRRLMDAARGA